MIRPIVTANQVIANKTQVRPMFMGMKNSMKLNNAYKNSDMGADSSIKGEKLDINCEGCRLYNLNGNKVNYFA